MRLCAPIGGAEAFIGTRLSQWGCGGERGVSLRSVCFRRGSSSGTVGAARPRGAPGRRAAPPRSWLKVRGSGGGEERAQGRGRAGPGARRAVAQGGGRAARGISAARRLLPGGAGRRGRRDSSPARCAQLAGKGLGRRGSPCRIQPFKHGAGRGGRAMTAGGRAGHGSGADLPPLFLGKNMPKARAGGAEEASPESVERKGPGRPRAGGVSTARAWAGGAGSGGSWGLLRPPLPPAVRASRRAGRPGARRGRGRLASGAPRVVQKSLHFE